MSTPELSFIIPARNEAATIEPNIHICLEAAELLGVSQDIIVVSDNSVDDTDILAKTAGAQVIRRDEHPSKAHALKEGTLHSDAEHVFYLDADLLGLKSSHLARIAEPVLVGKADMAIGNLDTFLGRRSLGFSGQRIMKRSWFPGTNPNLNGYNVELLIAETVGKRNGTTFAYVMEHVTQRTKFMKFGAYNGAIKELQEWGQIFFDARVVSMSALGSYLMRLKRFRD